MFLLPTAAPVAAQQTQVPDTSSSSENRPCRCCSWVDFDPAESFSVESHHWTDGIVPYAYSTNVSNGDRDRMRAAMDEIEAVTRIEFVPRNGEGAYIFIQDSDGNNVNRLGMGSGRTTVNIYNWNRRFIMCHELMHVLGFRHEHTRPDRDSYITINESCIDPDKLNNFNIAQSNGTMIGPYDYNSIMHYGATAFFDGSDLQCTSQHTIVAPQPIGNRDYLSTGDIGGMQHIYGVDEIFEAGLNDELCDGRRLQTRQRGRGHASPTDPDVWQVEIGQDGLVTWRYSGPLASVVVRDRDQTVVSTRIGGSPLPAIWQVPMSAGRHSVQIEPIGAGNYSVEAVWLAPTITAESESNNSMAAADDIGVARATGEISSALDSDWYRFDLARPGEVTLLTHKIGSGLADTQMTLYDAAGVELEFDRDGGPGSTSKIRRLLSAGIYYVEIEGDDSDDTGEYGLDVFVKEHGSIDYSYLQTGCGGLEFFEPPGLTELAELGSSMIFTMPGASDLNTVLFGGHALSSPIELCPGSCYLGVHVDFTVQPDQWIDIPCVPETSGLVLYAQGVEVNPSGSGCNPVFLPTAAIRLTDVARIQIY